MNPDLALALRVLELSENASFDEAKETYKVLVQIWHPDRFECGSKPYLRALEKIKEINHSYDVIKKHLDPLLRNQRKDSSSRFSSPNKALIEKLVNQVFRKYEKKLDQENLEELDRDNKFHLAIRVAMHENDLSLFSQLANEAPLLGKSFLNSLLLYAGEISFKHGIKKLLEIGADPNASDEIYDMTLLYRLPEPEIGQMLLTHGGNINYVSKNFKHIATHRYLMIDGNLGYFQDPQKRRTQNLRFYFENGLDANATGPYGESALHILPAPFLPWLKHPYLGLNVSGEAPSQLEKRRVFMEDIIKLFISFNADINHKDLEGRTPLDIAYCFENATAIDLFKKYGGIAKSRSIFSFFGF